ncbi:hypothetical protein FB451DRAFT_130060 [Mycena latifolia]|nr:hypothetical protein FB451DRAFT_130060 [Mycena latifolia]
MLGYLQINSGRSLSCLVTLGVALGARQEASLLGTSLASGQNGVLLVTCSLTLAARQYAWLLADQLWALVELLGYFGCGFGGLTRGFITWGVLRVCSSPAVASDSSATYLQQPLGRLDHVLGLGLLLWGLYKMLCYLRCGFG